MAKGHYAVKGQQVFAWLGLRIMKEESGVGNYNQKLLKIPSEVASEIGVQACFPKRKDSGGTDVNSQTEITQKLRWPERKMVRERQLTKRKVKGVYKK